MCPTRGAAPCAWKEQGTYGRMLSYMVQLGGTVAVADDDPTGPRIVEPRWARTYLDQADYEWGSQATCLLWHHWTRRRNLARRVYRMARAAAGDVEALAAALRCDVRKGLLIGPELRVPEFAFGDLVDYRRIARELLERLDAGKAPPDPMAEPAEDLPNQATAHVAARVGRTRGYRPAELRAQLLDVGAHLVRAAFCRDFQDLAPLVDWRAVAEHLVFGIPA